MELSGIGHRQQSFSSLPSMAAEMDILIPPADPLSLLTGWINTGQLWQDVSRVRHPFVKAAKATLYMVPPVLEAVLTDGKIGNSTIAQLLLSRELPLPAKAFPAHHRISDMFTNKIPNATKADLAALLELPAPPSLVINDLWAYAGQAMLNGSQGKLSMYQECPYYIC